MCAATPGCAGAGRDVICALPSPVTERKLSAMKNFIAPLSFTLAAAWVVVLFVLVHSNP
ncbi:hypothetical protein Adu01nite_46150 [Paractinoplanes durhamensis]|uniref:Uncharacterized protein n=1 Tax=Paractinoplanes durhamensis TaxID=113563 RepID=A0ABQ3Z0F2_9ACTN|nr:hypothetical protein Adu01nite_46150 [Actinoplanes durhamensis]